MDTLKVNLSLEPYATNSPHVRFSNYDAAPLYRNEGEVLTDRIEMSYYDWLVKQVMLPTGQKLNYLVRVDQQEIFKHLIEISLNDIEKLKDAAREEGYRKGGMEGLGDGKKIMRLIIFNLPWWKRLFKKF